MQDERKIGRALGHHTVVLEARVFACLVLRVTATTKRRIDDDRVEQRLPDGVGFAQSVPRFDERFAVVNPEFRVFQPVRQHVHIRQIVGLPTQCLLNSAKRLHRFFEILHYCRSQFFGFG